MKARNKKNALTFGLLLLLVILVIGLSVSEGISREEGSKVVNSTEDSSTKECIEPGCNNKRAPDSLYCFKHKPYTSYGGSSPKTYSTGTGGGSTLGTTGNRSNTGTYSTGGSGQKPSGSTTKPSTRTYNTLNNDPADYDDPEDYADDAWGDDFDDWGDAYDYWEDY